jgi:hypothetical protein
MGNLAELSVRKIWGKATEGIVLDERLCFIGEPAPWSSALNASRVGEFGSGSVA